MKFMLSDLLNSVDLLLLKLTRRAYKTIGNLENYLGIANWIDI